MGQETIGLTLITIIRPFAESNFGSTGQGQ